MHLLNQALSHTSYGAGAYHNERLEFLGDAALGLAVCHYLYEKYPRLREGDLSRIKSTVVSRAVLSRIAKRMRLGAYLLLGKGEEQSGGREKPSILADAFEAFLGALWLEKGFKDVSSFVIRFLRSQISAVARGKIVSDYKGLLQQAVQSKHKALPHYELVKTQGPPHRMVFTIKVKHKRRLLGKGQGTTKKEAEQAAAFQALKTIGVLKG